jgi:hypothetical protein
MGRDGFGTESNRLRAGGGITFPRPQQERTYHEVEQRHAEKHISSGRKKLWSRSGRAASGPPVEQRKVEEVQARRNQQTRNGNTPEHAPDSSSRRE